MFIQTYSPYALKHSLKNLQDLSLESSQQIRTILKSLIKKWFITPFSKGKYLVEFWDSNSSLNNTLNILCWENWYIWWTMVANLYFWYEQANDLHVVLNQTSEAFLDATKSWKTEKNENILTTIKFIGLQQEKLKKYIKRKYPFNKDIQKLKLEDHIEKYLNVVVNIINKKS